MHRREIGEYTVAHPVCDISGQPGRLDNRQIITGNGLPVSRGASRTLKSRPTALANVFSGRPTRCLVNSFMLEHGPLSDAAPPFPRGFSALGPLRAKAEDQGCREFSAHYCGQGKVLEHADNAAQLTRNLAADAGHRIKWMAGVAQDRVS